MKQRTFEQNHQQQWEILEAWLDSLDKRKAVEGKEIAQFPQRYRQVCQHLALAQDRHYTPHLIERLNSLVLRGHQHLYRTPSRIMAKMINVIRVDFPNSVRQEWQLVSLSSLLFFGALLIMFVSVQINPDLIYSLMTEGEVNAIEEMYHPNAEHLGQNRESDSDFLMFGYYIYNNIGIGFQTFAGGILFGLGTLFFYYI
ncbi:integral membrane protein [Beggiatoa sp. PS]|nr:integral membrane protein [Beggiatoa sp. PS]